MGDLTHPAPGKTGGNNPPQGERRRKMNKQEILERMAGFAADSESLEYCDALCDAAEYLGWEPGEYQYKDILHAIRIS